jgi:hypothetical protein
MYSANLSMYAPQSSTSEPPVAASELFTETTSAEIVDTIVLIIPAPTLYFSPVFCAETATGAELVSPAGTVPASVVKKLQEPADTIVPEGMVVSYEYGLDLEKPHERMLLVRFSFEN